MPRTGQDHSLPFTVWILGGVVIVLIVLIVTMML